MTKFKNMREAAYKLDGAKGGALLNKILKQQKKSNPVGEDFN